MNVQALCEASTLYRSFTPKAYDLSVRPNAVANGMLVEADDYGRILAADMPSGVSVRNNFSYSIARTSLQFEFVDMSGMIHPLD
ncbi:MAG: hypothetical protein K2Y39_15460 [Candidatus Obscuribacterales bacterium]|nr:hypothetical protein [Candidatus Obscuribacterales bacterium]